MANSFNKEERVAFETILEGFNDALVLSKNVAVFNTDQQQMERSNDIIWRPQPYIATSIDGAAGTDISASFKNVTQLSVPATIGYNKTVPWTMNALELRDALRNGQLGESAKQRLASDINIAIMNVAYLQGTLVVPIAAAATGFDDVAKAEAIMNETGVGQFARYLAMSTRDYNGAAGNLAGRENLVANLTKTAYEKAYVGMIASFETFKMDYANRLTLAAGVTVTVNGANQYHTPKATDYTVAGKINVDNRTQNLTIAVTSGTVKVGDCFTIAGVNNVHAISKQDTGQLKTFRIHSIVSGGGGSGVVKISPPIISGGGGTDAELAYKNCSATPANGAAITWLNIASAYANPFWHREAMEILPGRLAIEENAGAAVVRGTTDQGFELVMQKQWDINTNKGKYRMDTLFGVNYAQPEMGGIILFGQT